MKVQTGITGKTGSNPGSQARGKVKDLNSRVKSVGRMALKR